MSDSKNRIYYEPPHAIDLSDMSIANGGNIKPMGECAAGPYPYHNCVAGNGYNSSCGGGSNVDTSHCSSGGAVNYPACNSGGSALTGCLSGSHQNF